MNGEAAYTQTVHIEATGVDLRVIEAGKGPLVVLCHGFPELAYSWRHQVRAFAARGYRVIAPDMRGYGGSSRPTEVAGYDVLSLGQDLVGLLNAYGQEQAVFIGHDWGASVVWHLAVAHPDRVRAVAGLSVPFVPRAPAPPLGILRRRFGDDFYMAWFQPVGAADAALARDVRRTLTTTHELNAAWACLDEQPPLPAWLTEKELAVFVDAFETTGFTGGLNYYRNLDRNWHLTEPLADRKIAQPALFATGSEDLVRQFMPATSLPEWAPNLQVNEVIDGAGHWLQQERPSEISELLLAFVGSL